MVRLKHFLKSHAALCLAAICIVMSTWIGLVIWGRLAGPTVDATDIVTVVEYVDGNIGKHHRRFRHLVRTSAGAEYRMTFGELYPAGTRRSVINKATVSSSPRRRSDPEARSSEV